MVQSILNQLGYNAGPVDGIYGPKTEAGIKAFQKARGITVDGIYGPDTANHLGEALEESLEDEDILELLVDRQ
jgi:peptidoglycan hydrolase-like protein with peptidoglycan-binding domain